MALKFNVFDDIRTQEPAYISHVASFNGVSEQPSRSHPSQRIFHTACLINFTLKMRANGTRLWPDMTNGHEQAQASCLRNLSGTCLRHLTAINVCYLCLCSAGASASMPNRAMFRQALASLLA